MIDTETRRKIVGGFWEYLAGWQHVSPRDARRFASLLNQYLLTQENPGTLSGTGVNGDRYPDGRL